MQQQHVHTLLATDKRTDKAVYCHEQLEDAAAHHESHGGLSGPNAQLAEQALTCPLGNSLCSIRGGTDAAADPLEQARARHLSDQHLPNTLLCFDDCWAASVSSQAPQHVLLCHHHQAIA